MNNEPIAWMNSLVKWDIAVEQDITHDIPLYTHPANPKYDPETGEPLIDGYPLFSGLPTPPAKTLTDEEIEVIAEEYFKVMRFGLIADTKGFARAILRKAQEK